MTGTRTTRKLCAALVLTIGIVAWAFPSHAQTRTELLEQCRIGIETGDENAVSAAAAQMVEWGPLFSPITLSGAEECLEAATGEDWEYFSTRSRFLTGDEADAARAAINEAAARKEAREFELAKLECRVAIAEQRLAALVATEELNKQFRLIELELATLRSCQRLYQEDPDRALVNSACIASFRQHGLPDTEFPSNEEEQTKAQSALNDARVTLLDAVSPNRTGQNDQGTNLSNKALQECLNMLAE